MPLSFKYHLTSVCEIVIQWPTAPMLERPTEVFGHAQNFCWWICNRYRHSPSVTISLFCPIVCAYLCPLSIHFSVLPLINFSCSNWMRGPRFIHRWWLLVSGARVHPMDIFKWVKLYEGCHSVIDVCTTLMLLLLTVTHCVPSVA